MTTVHGEMMNCHSVETPSSAKFRSKMVDGELSYAMYAVRDTESCNVVSQKLVVKLQNMAAVKLLQTILCHFWVLVFNHV